MGAILGEEIWSIELLGRLAAVRGERSVTRFRTQRGGLLLAILALQPERLVSRDELGERLWPDEAPERQRERLRGELSDLRATLGEDIFEKQGNAALRLRPGIVSDVARFERAVLAAVRAPNPEQRCPFLETAATLYKGDLLPGYYDDGSVAERERLRESCFDVLTRLILDLEALGRSDEARRWRRDTAARFPEHALPAAPALPRRTQSVSEGYFGREESLELVAAWAADGPERVLTVTGPGGIGKTRLSREALPGAVFVALAGVRDARAGFFEAVHRALELPRGDTPWRQQVVDALQGMRRPLLVLDNFEQIVVDGAPLLAQLLKDCPALRCLVTSRRRLGIAGERDIALEPLPHRTSVALFLDRARRARPDFAQSPSSLQLVEETIDLLEGLPLALELAAARSVVLGPRQIKEQLAQRLQFLVNRRFPATERHRSLRAALDWSIDLLSPELRRVFARLSVFRGGWTLEAARIVCGAESLETLDALEELHGHSLIRVEFDGDEEPRYDLLVVVREYAAEVLESLGETAAAEARHADSVSALADDLQAALEERRLGALQSRLQAELENIRQALAWARAGGRHDLIYRWLDRLGGKLFEGGWWQDFKALMDAVDGHLDDDGKLLRFYSLRGALLRRQGQEDEAALYWTRWLALARRRGDTASEQWALHQLALQCLDRRDVAGARGYVEQFAERAGADDPMAALLRCRLSLLTDASRETTRAQTYRLLARVDPAVPAEQILVFYLVWLLLELGEVRDALSWSGRLLGHVRAGNQRFVTARALDAMAQALESLGDLRAALHAATLAARTHRQIASRFADESQQRAERLGRRPEIAPEWAMVDERAMWNTLQTYL